MTDSSLGLFFGRCNNIWKNELRFWFIRCPLYSYLSAYKTHQSSRQLSLWPFPPNFLGNQMGIYLLVTLCFSWTGFLRTNSSNVQTNVACFSATYTHNYISVWVEATTRDRPWCSPKYLPEAATDVKERRSCKRKGKHHYLQCFPFSEKLFRLMAWAMIFVPHLNFQSRWWVVLEKCICTYAY